MIREDFLQQNAFVDIDSYSEYRRQFLLLGLILHYDAECRDALEKNAADAQASLPSLPASTSAAPRACRATSTSRSMPRSPRT